MLRRTTLLIALIALSNLSNLRLTPAPNLLRPPALQAAPNAQALASLAALSLGWSSLEAEFTTSTAWGDVDNDGDLDLAVGNYGQLSRLYRNCTLQQAGDGCTPADHGLARTAVWQTSLADRTCSIAWGDYDGDGYIDLAVGSGCSLVDTITDAEPSRIYRNRAGRLDTVPIWSAPVSDSTFSLAWGDMDNDGDLDLAMGNGQALNNDRGEFQRLTPAVSRIYRNDGTDPATGIPLMTGIALPGDPAVTTSVAWGDFDLNGRLDLVAGNLGVLGVPGSAQSRIYSNIGTNPDTTPQWAISTLGDFAITFGVAVGDVDNNGFLDLVLANNSVRVGALSIPQQNQLYLNSAQGFQLAAWSPAPNTTVSVSLGDYDSDGDLDLATGNLSTPGTVAIGPVSAVYTNCQVGGTDPVCADGQPFSNQPTILLAAQDDTFGLAWGDVDNDGDLDLATGNAGTLLTGVAPGQPNRVYRNDLGTLQPAGQPIATDQSTMFERSRMVVGDLDADGFPELITANGSDPPRLYHNRQGTFQLDSTWVPTITQISSMALGDANGDGQLDLALVGNNTPPEIFLTSVVSGVIQISAPIIFPDLEPGYLAAALAWGDVDNDGDLDLALACSCVLGPTSRLYRNDGVQAGQLHFAVDTTIWNPAVRTTEDLAWGDVDNDGDLDLVAVNQFQPSQLYRNQNGHLELDLRWQPPFDRSSRVAWGDMDGDGDLDLAIANYGKPAWVFRNDAGQLTNLPVWTSVEAQLSRDISWGDMDGDGDLDLAVGNAGFPSAERLVGQPNRVYRNDNGQLTPSAAWATADSNATFAIAWADVDRDSDLDLIALNKGDPRDQTGPIKDGPLLVYLNQQLTRADEAPPRIVNLRTPAPTIPGIDDYGTTVRITERQVSFSYLLRHPNGRQVARVLGEYSLNGGASWQIAQPAMLSETLDLASSASGVAHWFTWDVWASGVMGQSDNVVFRLRAIPRLQTPPGSAAGAFQYASTTATTTRFRLRGTQVQVIGANGPVRDALVYRLPADRAADAQPYADLSHTPFRTDDQGFLRGRGQIALGDKLLAALPISSTATTTRLLTSAAITLDGLLLQPVTTQGVQVLQITNEHALLLFNLDISVEWDARRDSQFLEQLRTDLKKTAAALFDWTDGQATLGQVQIYYDKQHWNDAHIRIYATNRLRPTASQGGIVADTTIDPDALRATSPVTAPVTYEPGQIRIGVVWNRYGESTSNQGDDWPRTLAHELGHFALFLDDNYLGFDQSGKLIPVNTCLGAMSDPYTAANSEFHPSSDWDLEQTCRATLSNRSTRRSDWATIVTMYNNPDLGFGLRSPQHYNENPGPATLQLALPTMITVTPAGPLTPIDAPLFSFFKDGTPYTPGRGARAFLFSHSGTQLTDLGTPSSEQVLARGAQPGDRVCLFEYAAGIAGCQDNVQAGQDQITVRAQQDWHPDVIITPVTSQTVTISVTQVITGNLKAQLYTSMGTVLPEITLAPASAATTSTYIGTFTSADLNLPLLEGLIHIWVDGTSPKRELVVDYSVGGDPGFKRSRGTPRGSPGFKRSRGAPVVSSDGQVLIYGDNLSFGTGQFFIVQTAGFVPKPKLGYVLVGQAYRVSANQRELSGSLKRAAIDIGYLGVDVPNNAESTLQIHYFDGKDWMVLPTQLDRERNEATAAMRGPGIYALQAGFELPLVGAAWNQFAYPLEATRAITDALAGLESSYSVVAYRDLTPQGVKWQLFAPRVPIWVDDLTQLEPAHIYAIYVTEDITVTLDPDPPLRLAALNEAMLLPPARLYASIPVSLASGLADDTPVVAQVDGTACGTAKTRRQAGAIVFVIDVPADDLGQSRGCGALGRSVQIQVGGLSATIPWDNRKIAEVALQADSGWRMLLPLMLHDSQ